LAPTPLRGKRNEPAHVVHTLAYLATLHGMDQTEAARRTTANARKLFAIPPGDD
jgi:TatD DNase family protein